MIKAAKLSKDRELELGEIIQKHYAAKETLNEITESGKRITSKRKLLLEAQVSEGKEAIDELVKANMGLVYSAARQYNAKVAQGPEYEDLVQMGMIGLMIAVEKYDPSRGNKFSTVAYSWVNQQIVRGSNTTGRTVRLPENRVQDYTNMNKIAASDEAKGLSPAELDLLIIEKLGISQSDINNIRTAANGAASLNKVIGGEAGSRELIDFVGDDNATQSGEDEALKNEMSDVLRNAVYSLEPVKRDVILSSFTLPNEETITKTKVYSVHNIKPFKYKRLQAEAMQDLKTTLEVGGFSFSDFIGLI